MHKTSTVQRTYILAALGVIVLLLLAWWYMGSVVPAVAPTSKVAPGAPVSPAAASAKGVVQLEQPTAGVTLASPLQVTGFVYGNNGTLTITLKQKGSGVTVAQKQATVSGQADQIRFAESLLFALPAEPQPGLLEVKYKDASSQGLDDAVTIEVNFPSDLGSGL